MSTCWVKWSILLWHKKYLQKFAIMNGCEALVKALNRERAYTNKSAPKRAAFLRKMFMHVYQRPTQIKYEIQSRDDAKSSFFRQHAYIKVRDTYGHCTSFLLHFIFWRLTEISTRRKRSIAIEKNCVIAVRGLYFSFLVYGLSSRELEAECCGTSHYIP